MSTLVKEVIIPKSRYIGIKLPSDIPEGEATITVTIKPNKPGTRVNRLGELYGSGKGRIHMTDDFDAPLEDFKDYM